ncbi:DUF4908 domain-containing protein [Brevundimonas sp.]|uniref:DUF4908 domain-containing protein n=1 Tax=Brevundimonas sp. TaxID=1871086 RepID=UPI0035B37192
MQFVTRSGATRSSDVGALALAFAAALAVMGVAPATSAQQRSNVQAEQNRSIGQRVFSRGLPIIARYASASGEVFVLDRSGPRTLLRFEDEEEVFALRAQAAPRGDVVYRNDAGETVLRISREGGLTLYSDQSPSGSPVFSFGAGEPLELDQMSSAELAAHLGRQSRRANIALGRIVFFLAIELPRGSEATVADAATGAANVLIAMAANPASREAARSVRRVEILQGRRAGANLSGGTLRVFIDPGAGASGRPSSARLVAAIQGR